VFVVALTSSANIDVLKDVDDGVGGGHRWSSSAAGAFHGHGILRMLNLVMTEVGLTLVLQLLPRRSVCLCRLVDSVPSARLPLPGPPGARLTAQAFRRL
jgi:hypothetical protein